MDFRGVMELWPLLLRSQFFLVHPVDIEVSPCYYVTAAGKLDASGCKKGKVMILFVSLNKHHPQGSFIAIVLGHKNLKLNLFKVPPLGNWGRGRYSYFISVVPEDNYVEMGCTRSPVWPTTALRQQ